MANKYSLFASDDNIEMISTRVTTITTIANTFDIFEAIVWAKRSQVSVRVFDKSSAQLIDSFVVKIFF